MAAPNLLRIIDLDAIAGKVVKFAPFERFLRPTLYVIWPLFILNVIIASTMLTYFVITLFDSPNPAGVAAQAQPLFLIYGGLFALIAITLIQSWLVSSLRSEWIAAIAVVQLVLGIAFVIAMIMTATRVDPTYYSFFHLLTVSPVYQIYFALSVLMTGWLLFELVRGVVALVRIPAEHRFLARPEFFDTRFVFRALNRFGGLPSVIEYLPRQQYLKFLYYLSSLCFFISFAALVQLGATYGLQDTALRSLCTGASNLNACLAANVLNIQIYVFAGCLLAIVAAPWLGHRLLAAIRKRSLFGLSEMQTIDPRPPVLFLRAFRDDQIPLVEPRRSWLGHITEFGRKPTNLDHLLVELATPYGPVVALGNPADALPPYGAARGYFEHKDWQASVSQLADESTAIVLCLDDTEGVWWEIKHLCERNLFEKTLFLLHPKDAPQPTNRETVRKLLDGLPDSVPAASKRALQEAVDASENPVVALFFDTDRAPMLATSATFSRLTFTLAVRWFLRLKHGYEPPPPQHTRDAAFATSLSVAWLIFACVTIMGVGRLFIGTAWNVFPQAWPKSDGAMLSGAISGTVLAIIAGAALAVWRRWRVTSAAVAIYWLGSSMIIAMLMLPLTAILRITLPRNSWRVALAVGCCGVASWLVAYLINRRRPSS